jgi:hypothetical protein
MSLAIDKIIGLIESTRHIGMAVRAAAEFERARGLRSPAEEHADRAKGIPL